MIKSNLKNRIYNFPSANPNCMKSIHGREGSTPVKQSEKKLRGREEVEFPEKLVFNGIFRIK